MTSIIFIVIQLTELATIRFIINSNILLLQSSYGIKDNLFKLLAKQKYKTNENDVNYYKAK